MQAEGALPWEVTCRGVVDGIALVAAHGPATGQAVRRGGARSARLRRGQGPLDHRTVWRKHDEEQQHDQGVNPWKGDEKIVRVETLDDFDRELARDGGEALEVPASLAEQYGLFPEDVGTEDEIRDAAEDPHGPEEEDR